MELGERFVDYLAAAGKPVALLANPEEERVGIRRKARDLKRAG